MTSMRGSKAETLRAYKLDKSFAEMEKEFLTNEYYTMFFKELNKRLKAAYGQEETVRILKNINNKKLKILNPEIFFNSYYTASDPAHRLYSQRKDLDSFLTLYTVRMQEFIRDRITSVDLPRFLLGISSMKSVVDTDEWLLCDPFKSFLKATMVAKPLKSPATFQLLDLKTALAISEKLGFRLSVKKYGAVCNQFIKAHYELQKTEYLNTVNFPKLEIVHAMYRDDRVHANAYLEDLFAIKGSEVKSATSEVKDFTVDSSELRAAISILKAKKSELFNVDEDEVVKEVNRVAKEFPYVFYPSEGIYTIDIGFPVMLYKDHEVSHSFIALEACDTLAYLPQSEIEINCEKIKKFEDAEELIGMAAKLALVRYRLQGNKKVPFKDCKMKITLTKLGFYSQEFLDKVRNMRESLKSLYNKDFIVSVKFNEEFATTRFPEQPSEYIRVISDIHYDINKGRGYTFNFGNDFVVNCGDTAGEYTTAADWMCAYMKKGVVVVGNHLGYDYPNPEVGPIHVSNTKTTQSKRLAQLLDINSNVRLLSPNSQEVVYDGVYFLGNTLCSDFKLYGEGEAYFCEQEANRCINDFKRVYVVDSVRGGASHVAPYTTTTHKITNSACLRHIRVRLAKLKDKPVVVTTHFCPLPFSVAPEYKGELLTAYFTSNLKLLFSKFDNIRLWCHGHTHSKFDYIYRRTNKSGKVCETRVVCDPFGYYNENNADLPNNYGTRIKIADIKSDEPWTEILAKEIAERKVQVFTDEDIN